MYDSGRLIYYFRGKTTPTLRDLSRVLGRYRKPGNFLSVELVFPDRGSGWTIDCTDHFARSVDRAVSKHGARAPWWVINPARFAPKHTEDVMPSTTATADNVHGGDGTSFEVRHQSASPMAGPRDDGDTPSTPDRHEDPERSGGDAAGRPGAESGAEPQEGEATAGVPEEGLATPADFASPDAADTPGCDAPGAACATSAAEDGDSDATEDGGEAASPADHPVPRIAHGGIFSSWDDRGGVPVEDRAAASDILRALRRLVHAISETPATSSPRLHPRGVVREMISRRWALSRARREEMGLPRLVAACDVSGSCSAAAPGTIAAANALSIAHPVAVIIHSNGYLESLTWRGRTVTLDRDRGLETWLELVPADSVLLYFGDWDAGDLVIALARRGRRVLWLDSYAARAGGVRPVTPASAIYSADAANIVWAWWTGINSPATAAIAIRQIVKRT